MASRETSAPQALAAAAFKLASDLDALTKEQVREAERKAAGVEYEVSFGSLLVALATSEARITLDDARALLEALGVAVVDDREQPDLVEQCL